MRFEPEFERLPDELALVVQFIPVLVDLFVVGAILCAVIAALRQKIAR